MPPPPSDALLPLLLRLRGQDAEADWDRFIALTQAALRVVCASRLSSDLLVEDAVQESLLRCRDGLAGADWPDEPSAWAWLRRIAFNTAANLAKSEQARRARERRAAGSATALLAEPPPRIDEELARLVARHVAELPERQRLALELRYRQGLDVRDAAHRLELSEVNFRALAHRALQSLRQRLGGRGAAVPLVLLVAAGFELPAAVSAPLAAGVAGDASAPWLASAVAGTVLLAAMGAVIVSGALGSPPTPPAQPASASAPDAPAPTPADRYAEHVAAFHRSHVEVREAPVAPRRGWYRRGRSVWSDDSGALRIALKPSDAAQPEQAWLIHDRGLDAREQDFALVLEFEPARETPCCLHVGLLGKDAKNQWSGQMAIGVGADELMAGDGRGYRFPVQSGQGSWTVCLQSTATGYRCAIEGRSQEGPLPDELAQQRHCLFPYLMAKVRAAAPPTTVVVRRAVLLIGQRASAAE